MRAARAARCSLASIPKHEHIPVALFDEEVEEPAAVKRSKQRRSRKSHDSGARAAEDGKAWISKTCVCGFGGLVLLCFGVGGAVADASAAPSKPAVTHSRVVTAASAQHKGRPPPPSPSPPPLRPPLLRDQNSVAPLPSPIKAASILRPPPPIPLPPPPVPGPPMPLPPSPSPALQPICSFSISVTGLKSSNTVTENAEGTGLWGGQCR